MSLSKPFRLFDLPLLPLEQVLFRLKSKHLFFFALRSEKARQLLRKCYLVKYFDINVWDTSVIFWICFKSEEPIKWKFTMKLPVNASEESRRSANRELLDGKKRTARVFKLDDMRMVLWETKFEDPVEMRCSLPKEHFVDYTRRIGHLFQSICPGQRIGFLVAGNVGWKDEKVFFHMDRNTRCDNFHFVMYDQDNFLEILEKMDVKREITLVCKQDKESNLEWMKNEKIRNIPHLRLVHVINLNFSQILKQENEHLQLFDCKVNGSDLHSFLKKWMSGEFTKRGTLEVLNCIGQGFDDRVWDGLTPEPMETWEKLGKPELVRFSNNYHLNPTPRTVPGKYQTILLKNCNGQFATAVRTDEHFFFAPWDHPLPPIKIPKGHRLWQCSDRPFTFIVPQHF